MTPKDLRIPAFCMVLVALTNARLALADGWNPFASSHSSASQAAPTRNTRTEPSVFEKMGTGAKNAWCKVTGQTQETERQKNDRCYARPTAPVLVDPRRKKPWFSSEEPAYKGGVTGWLKETERPKLE